MANSLDSQCCSIGEALAWAKAELRNSQVSDDGQFDSSAIDSKTLLAACLQKDQVFLHTWPEHLLSKAQLTEFHNFIHKRCEGHPVAHIVGFRDFWTLRLKVSPATLIPRPETELLVEIALALPLQSDAKVLDLGTGTGAIALALASEKPDWLVSGADISEEAVALAIHNAEQNKLNAKFIQSDWLGNLAQQRFDLIVSNPPYIENVDPYLQQGDVRFEPASALTSGQDGLDDIRKIIKESRAHLNHGAWVLIEHGYQQHLQVAEIFQQHGYTHIRSEYDLNHLPRVTLAKR